MKVGTTTYPEMVRQLGEPSSVSLNSDGTRVAAYVFNSVAATPASFIPYVGLFAGGTNVKTTGTTFTFGVDGKLASYSTTDTALAGGVGATGRSTPREAPAAVAAALPPGVCNEPNAARCQGDIVETCNKSTMKWEKREDCRSSALACSSSAFDCTDGSGACCH